jgi:hypothetical protein
MVIMSPVLADRQLALGATRLPSTEPGFRVYADPARHPFCLEWG